VIGRRFIESEPYRRAHEDGHFRSGRLPDELSGIPVSDNAELRSALQLRTYSDLTMFEIEGTPFVGELAAFSRLPSFVETIPTEKVFVELSTELSENELATAVNDGQPYPEGQLNFGGSPTLTKIPRFGVGQPVSLGILDEPGQVSSVIDRRMQFGVGLGLENDILNGNGFWTGAIAGAGNTLAKGAGYRAFAIRGAVAMVQDNGWYARPLQVVINPLTAATLFEEEDGSGRPLAILDMFDDNVDTWIVSKEMPAGQALVGDFFSAIALFVKGGLEIATSRNHQDFLTRSMVELTLGFRCYSWLRQPTALCAVTGIS
jgi:hypothetical protein